MPGSYSCRGLKHGRKPFPVPVWKLFPDLSRWALWHWQPYCRFHPILPLCRWWSLRRIRQNFFAMFIILPVNIKLPCRIKEATITFIDQLV
jgi:hypothetical protein